MRSTESFEEVRRAIRSHVAVHVPNSQIEEEEKASKGRRYAVLRVVSNGQHVDIYVYDDGDFGFTSEDGQWFPLEIWDERDDEKRLDRLYGMLEKHASMFARQLQHGV